MQHYRLTMQFLMQSLCVHHYEYTKLVSDW